MGLTAQSSGLAAIDAGLRIRRSSPEQRVIAIGGNPNVGKSTIVNALTGLRQHTGNWPGKTVAAAQGSCQFRGKPYTLVDIPCSPILPRRKPPGTFSASAGRTRPSLCATPPVWSGT